ncbi:MAG: thiolase family protein [Alphaproteobacteria bacterium]|nr:thiolase family protein [Alphaproteobacteria bacterium]
MNAPLAIVGVGETPPARRSESDLRGLVLEAVSAALDDAGLAPHDVDGLISESGIMPQTVPHQWLAAQLGVDLGFHATTSLGGAGTVSAPLLAGAALAAGLAHVVVCYFGVDWGSQAGAYAFHDVYPAKRAFEKPYGFTGQPTYFALWAQRYRHLYGLAEDDLALIALAQRQNARRNGRAQAREPMTLEDYLASRPIADPLRAADCCLLSDGAGAYVMTSTERAGDCAKAPVQVLGTGFASPGISGDDVFTQLPEPLEIPGAAAAAKQAFQRAGIGPEDVDFAEIYDCFTISALLQIEDLGFCAKGEAAAFIRDRGITSDGGLPVNTHGGLLSYSYCVGIEHVVEAVRQLRGEAGAQVSEAKIGLVGALASPDYGVMVLGN